MAPILERIDGERPLTLGQGLLSGPHREASRIEGMAEGRFPITTSHPEAQAKFNLGMGYLHGLRYPDAARAFRDAWELDQENPMPLFGLALANERRPGRARLFAHEALVHIRAETTDRERAWLEMLGAFYELDRETQLADTVPPEANRQTRSRRRIRDLERILDRHPDSIEALAFLIRELVLAEYHHGIAPRSRMAVDALLDRLLERAPGHPAALYRIFLWMPERPGRAVEAADACLKGNGTLPDLWSYAAEANRRAGDPNRAVFLLRESLARSRRLLGRREPASTAAPALVAIQARLVETLTSAGRAEEALIQAHHLASLPCPAGRMGSPVESGGGTLPVPATVGRRLRAETLMRMECWERLHRELRTGGPLASDPDDVPVRNRAEQLLWQGMAALMTEREDALTNVLATLRGESPPSSPGTPPGENGQGAENETARLLALARTCRTGGADEDLSDAQLDLLRNRLPLETTARLAFSAGDRQSALELVTRAREDAPGSLLTEAACIDLHHQAGGRHATRAARAFDHNFRKAAGRADEDLPIQARLAPVAARLRLGSRWRLPAADASTLPEGVTSILASRSPDVARPSEAEEALLSPLPAPDFALPDRSGETRSLSADFRGRPLVLNFFLGVGCLYCAEQLDLFRPFVDDFRAAGIEMVAVSTDSLEALRTSLDGGADQEKGGSPSRSFPFPVLADPDLRVFREYGVIDDHDMGGMHGTFLVDGGGRILWQDVDRLPFDQPGELLREARRLLRSNETASSPTEADSAASAPSNPNSP